MTSAFDLYKGTARRKRKGKTTGESSQRSPKKARVDEPAMETPSEVPVIEVVETPPRRVDSPPAVVVDEPRVEVPFVPSPVEEPVPENTSRESRQELFDSVAKMMIEHVENVRKNKKYLKASSSFKDCNFGQALSRASSDITMVIFLLAYLS